MTALYQANALSMIRLAHVMLGDRGAAEDVVQEAFCGLYRRWAHVSDQNRALSYVRSSVLNSCRSALRRIRPQLSGDLTDSNLRLNQASVESTVLLVPRNAIVRGFALSPSGTELAVTYSPAAPHLTEVLKIMDLATGAVRTWTSSQGQVLYDDKPTDLSWAADHTLAFSWYGLSLTPQRELPTSGLWLLDTAKPGGDLIADSRRVLVYRSKGSQLTIPGNGYLATMPVVTQDGRTVLAPMTSRTSDTGGYAWFGAYDAANGKLDRIFDRTSLSKAQATSAQAAVLWTDTSGHVLVVDAPPGHRGRIGILRQSGRLTLLPASHGQELTDPAPAW